MVNSSKFDLSDEVLAWIVTSVDPGASVESVRRLVGGISSIVHSVSLRFGDDVKGYVVRQFNDSEWLSREPDLVLHEGGSLSIASKVNLPTPELIAYDKTGEYCGMPTVLMTQLKGSVILSPIDMANWLNGLAESLLRIHEVEANDFPWSYYTYNNMTTIETPAWSSVPQLWSKAIDIVRGAKPEANLCFIHRDYHPTNVLWFEDKVSGVVDWVNACRGPAGIDLGHCRWNLALLFNVITADQFLSAYHNHAGTTFHYDPYWDLLSLMDTLFGPPNVYPGWTALGVTGLTADLMRERVDAYLISILERINHVQ